LRPVVERTLAVVRAGMQARPPVAAPPALAPVLRFRHKHMPSAAVDTVVVVLEHDAELRARVAAESNERDLRRVGWLWLTRPEGWDTELREALGELAADDGAPSASDVGTDAQLRRRLAGAERAAARSNEQLARLDADNARVRDEANAIRVERDAAVAERDALRAEVDDAVRERTRAVADLKRIEKLLARRDEERRLLQSRLDHVDASLVKAASRDNASDAAAIAAADAARASLAGLVDRIERALGEAAVTVDELRAAAGLPAAGATTECATPARAKPPVPERRRALRMPRGLVDDSPEAAAWLVSERPVLLVDGYNVSMTAWPDAEIAEQRTRLARLLADLAARSPGISIELVFDGDSVDAVTHALPARTGLNVRFTEADVEADDELLTMIGRYPIARPVVVASTDRRVRDGARRRGANVVSAHQLLAVARG
jgi:predicted RNA-binding protein with PIN domain